MGLLVAGGLAIVFAAWRGWVAERQSATARRQAETSQEQADTAYRGLLNERYQRGAEMLGSEVLTVRMAGIYALQRLAEEHPEQYHIQIMRLLCSFVRNPPGEDESQGKGHVGETEVHRIREDVQAVMNVLGNRGESGVNLENLDSSFRLDFSFSDLRAAFLDGYKLDSANLRGANLSHSSMDDAQLHGAFLSGADVSRASLMGTNLSRARLWGTNFTESMLYNADLSWAYVVEANFSQATLLTADLSATRLQDVNFSDAILKDANLSNADLVLTWSAFDETLAVHKLTQEQLDEARCDPHSPPNIQYFGASQEEVRLLWRGCSIEA